MADACRRICVAIATSALLSGCAGTRGTGFDRPEGPHERLETQLSAWRASRAEGGGCEASRFRDSPLEDCAEIQHQVETLALEYPRDPEVLFASAVMANDAGQAERAVSWLDALFAVSPAHADAGVLRARLAARDGDLRLARTVLREQLQYAPDHAGLYEGLASVEYLAGDLDSARRALGDARALGAPAWRVEFNLGLVEEAAGDRELAKRAYRAALEANPEHSPAASRLRALESVAP